MQHSTSSQLRTTATRILSQVYPFEQISKSASLNSSTTNRQFSSTPFTKSKNTTLLISSGYFPSSSSSAIFCEENSNSSRTVNSKFSKNNKFQHIQTRTMAQGPEKVVKSEEEWKKILNASEYDVIRMKGTEMARTGEYDKHYPKKGYYKCKACDYPLYSYAAKFNSGCGWPAYNKCYKNKATGQYNVIFAADKSFGMVRIEILCRSCDGHLGHVFLGENGKDTERHCVNSVSVKYVDGEEPDDVESDVLLKDIPDEFKR